MTNDKKYQVERDNLRPADLHFQCCDVICAAHKSWNKGYDAALTSSVVKELVEALEALYERHKWHPDMGACICKEHIKAAQILNNYQKAISNDQA